METNIQAGISLDSTEVLHRGEFYTEGPAVDAAGNLYFTTLRGGKIMKLDTEGNLSVWATGSCPNGQRILSNGEHLVCDSVEGKVIRYDPDGRKIGNAAVGYCEDMLISTPNDLAVDEGSGFYFTDSIRNEGAVYFFDNDGSARIVARGLDYPNGICLSADRRRLFVAESYKNRILVFDISAPGISAGDAATFCELPRNSRDPLTGNLPDGIALDTAGRLWVAHYGMASVHVISERGRLLASIPTDIPLTSNLCFSRDFRGIYVTGGAGEPGPGSVSRLTFSNHLP